MYTYKTIVNSIAQNGQTAPDMAEAKSFMGPALRACDDSYIILTELGIAFRAPVV